MLYLNYAVLTTGGKFFSMTEKHTSFFLVNQVVKRLPKTRSGKIMRRLLRRIVTGNAGDLGDITTLDDPSVIKEILDTYEKYKEKHPTL